MNHAFEKPNGGIGSLRNGRYAAATVWLLLVASSLAWNACQIVLCPSPAAAAAASTRQRHAANALFHLAAGAVGLAAVEIGYRKLRRSRNALAASEERYRLISSVAMDYVFSSAVEPGGRLNLQWVSGAFEEITGFAFEDYLARGGWKAALHPDDVAQDERDLHTLRANLPLKTELRTIAKDGRIVWVEVFAHPVWDSRQNRLAGIYGSVRDVSRRKRAEAETKATLELLNQFVDSVPAFGAFVDREERYQFVNRYHENWFKNSRERFIGRKLSDVHRPSTYAIMQPYSQQALAGLPVRYEHEMTGRDGKFYCFDVQYVPRLAADGSVLGYFSLVFDVTERVLRDRQLLRTQRLESVGRLASGIAHDLNNILAPVMMGPDLLRESIQDPSALSVLDVIEASARRGAAILRQLLAFGRGEPESRAPLDLAPLVAEMAKIVEETFPKNIAFSACATPNLPPVHGNVTQLHQVLMNLCINARDAMPNGGSLSLAASVEHVGESLARTCGAPQSGLHVVLSVADTGSGIPPEIVDKIFDPFFTTKPMGQGTGLGLASSMGIVQSHRGFIRVDSRVGHGTQFRVYLPVGAALGALDSPAPTENPPKGRGETILLVDDEDLARNLARQVLEQNGYRVIEARNGQEALSICECPPSRVDMAIVDLMMPVMDGPTFLRRLRNLHPGVKTIAVSGGLSQDEMAQAVDSESTALLLKPFGASMLLLTLRRVLDS